MLQTARRTLLGVVAVVAVAVPAGAVAASTSGSGPSAAVGAPDVVRANGNVSEELDELRRLRAADDIRVVRVASATRLVDDDRFLDNVHELQDFLNENDATVLAGADVAIRDLLAIDVLADGDVVLFSR